MPGRAAGCVLVASALAVVAGCTASTAAPPLTIGVLVGCSGPLSSGHETVEAAAELPLLQRGARRPAGSPSAADVLRTTVAGQAVELRFGCVAGDEDVIPEARRLVEEDGARAIVGPTDPIEGMVLRAYARRRPGVAFLVQPSAAPELTLDDPAQNVFRFAPDAAQAVAGLATYAYRTLGWRTAVAVGDDNPYGWAQVAGFAAEFCALGGRELETRWVAPDADGTAVAASLPDADGVYLQSAFVSAVPFLRNEAARRPGPSRVVATSPLLADRTVARLARGAIVASPLAPGGEARRRYLAAFGRAFPALAATALDPVAVAYRDGVEAVLEAIPRARPTGGLQGALGRLALDSPTGLLRLDGRRQAVTESHLSRVAVSHGRARLEPVATFSGVGETFAGLLPASPPSRSPSPCEPRSPAPWQVSRAATR